MNETEIIEMIQKTESATFTINGLGETTIQTKELDFLIQAYAKQILKKPKHYAETEEDFAHAKCPTCKDVLETVPLLIKNNYCDECGQKIDWSVEE